MYTQQFRKLGGVVGSRTISSTYAWEGFGSHRWPRLRSPVRLFVRAVFLTSCELGNQTSGPLFAWTK